MMRFSRKTRGVISIFLILILVPTMVFSALLVDGSRMVSARAITQEAADLAALSVLSNYHSDLKEDFGLFALEDTSKAEAIFKESLSATLQASGFDASTYSEQVWDIFKNAVGAANPYEGKSFMNLYDFQLDNTSVTPLYSLANPEVLQNQIVEYSKYRGLYVISERLGILDMIENISKQADEQEESADAMEEKMDVDEKNGKADNKIDETRERVLAVNEKLTAVSGAENTFFSYLDAEMTVLAGVGEISRQTKEDAKEYNKIKGNIQTAFLELGSVVDDLDKELTKTKSEVQKAITKLKNYIGKYQGSDNETIQGLVRDAQESLTAYETCIQDMDRLETDNIFRTLVDNQVGEQMAGVIENIDNAVSRYSGEQDTEDEEDLYKFYYYESESKSEDAKDVKPDYQDAWKEGVRIELPASIPELSASTDYYGGSVSQEDYRNKVKSESGTNQSVERQKAGGNLQSIEKSVYDALPSRTFRGDKVAEMSLDFYREDGNLDGAKSILNGGKDSFLTELKNTAEIARDEVLTLSYIFGTFKTRMTGYEKFKKGAVDESKLDEFYMVPWRYLHEDGELDLQFEAKSKRTTQLNAEIEYLIYGYSSDLANESAAYAAIFAPRMANNMIALYQNQQVNKSCKTAARATSAAVAAASLGTVHIPYMVFFWLYLSAWTIAETILDMHYLIDEGYRIPLFKTKDTVLLELDFSAGASDGLVENYRKSSGSDKNIYVCYEDYLLLMLLLKSSDERLMRIADLVQMNMQKQDSGFTMDQAYTYICAESDLSIRYLFLNTAPLSIEYQKAGLGGRLKFENVIYLGY